MDAMNGIDDRPDLQSDRFTNGSQAKGNLVCTESGRLTGCDAGAAAMLGFAGVTELLDAVEDVSDLFGELTPDGEALIHAVAANQGREYRWLRADGQSIWVVLRARRVESPEGAPDPDGGCFHIAVRDVTGRRHLEAQLQDAQELELRGQIVTGMVNDMNNILAAVLAQAELAQGSLEIRDVVGLSQDLDGLRETALRGSRMVWHILSFSRGEGLGIGTVDLAHGIEGAARLIRPVLPSGINFKVIAGATPPVRADLTAVERILLRLTRDARRAMPEGGTLQIHVGEGEITEEDVRVRGWGSAGRYGVVTVSDTGAGFSPEEVARMFEPFEGREAGEPGDGAGMGLVYALMKQHRGFVDIESTPGSGTRIRLYFPVASDRPTDRPDEPVPPEHESGQSTSRQAADPYS